MPVGAKICGVSTPEAMDAAIAGGASHVGLVFFPKSPRDVTADAAAALARRAAGRVRIVGLFVDPHPDQVAAVAARLHLDAIQLHGDEPPELVSGLAERQRVETWKAVPVRTAADLGAAARYVGSAHRIVFDAKAPPGAALPGGNGLRFDWRLLSGHRHALPWMLSGGLDAGNVAEAVRTTGAPLVDVSSGVERAPGVKDVDKIAAFLKAVAIL